MKLITPRYDARRHLNSAPRLPMRTGAVPLHRPLLFRQLAAIGFFSGVWRRCHEYARHQRRDRLVGPPCVLFGQRDSCRRPGAL